MSSDPQRMMAEQQRRAREAEEHRLKAQAEREIKDDIDRIMGLMDEEEQGAPPPAHAPAPLPRQQLHPNLSTPQTRQMGLGVDSPQARQRRRQLEEDMEVPPPPPEPPAVPPPDLGSPPVVKDNDFRLGLEIVSDEIETRPRGRRFRVPKSPGQDRDF
jgi:hypothetical protein